MTATPFAKIGPQLLPLSIGQRALWHLCQMDPDAGGYNIFYAWHIRTPLNVPALRRALERLVARHEAWRSTFSVVDGEPMQQVHPERRLVFTEVDTTGWSEEHLAAQIENEIYRPFDLSRETPVRWKLYTRPEADPIIGMQLHHLGTDAWSVMRIANDLRDAYAAEVNDRAWEPGDDMPEHRDFLDWQEQFLRSSEADDMWAFWHEHMAGELPVFNMQTDKPRPPLLTIDKKSLRFRIPAEVVQRVSEASREAGISPFIFYLSVFEALLHRYTGQEEILVGVPTATRGSGKKFHSIRGLSFERSVGYFVNPVVFRSRADGNPRWSELLRRTAGEGSLVLRHRDYPFPLIAQRILTKRRDPSRTPIFQVSFLWEDHNSFANRDEPLVTMNDNGNEMWDMGEMTWERVSIQPQIDELDLSFKIQKAVDGYHGVVSINPNLYSDATMARIAKHYNRLLESVLAEGDRRLSDLALLDEAEKRCLIADWNRTRVDYARVPTLHGLFEEMAAKAPQRTAAAFCLPDLPAEELSFAALNGRANQVAHYLRAAGIGPEDSVGLYMERSLDMLVALLGILKAGGGYVPLDPAFPQERLAYMAQDARLKVLVTHVGHLPDLPEHGATVVTIDGDGKAIAACDTGNPAFAVDGDNRAYTIYTSGSTGWPKGVQITHRCLHNFLSSMAEKPGMNEDDTLLSVTTLSFDIAGLELYLPLIRGGRVVLTSKQVAADGAGLCEVLESCEATVMQATPITWRLLLAAGWLGKPDLKILCGGEALPGELAEQLVPRCASLWNMYGPTETTIWSTLSHIQAGEKMTIGKPIANTQVYILDAHLQLVPPGVPGELLIGGDGLARGYHRRPDLTASQFVPDPFGGASGGRLYRTGDLACHQADGKLECLGRIDNQVKIRGFRIELGEIETVLAKQPGVVEAVVVAREDQPDNKVLVGYLIPDHASLDTGGLRYALTEFLPDYMIPTQFVKLDQFPMTPNGKIDRRALPKPEMAEGQERGLVAPRTPVENILADIWQAILGREQIGINEDFFLLGGHSLLATRIISRIRDVLNVEVPQQLFFRSPTIADLALVITDLGRKDRTGQIPPIRPYPRERAMPVSFGQQRLWFIDKLAPNDPVYNIHFALELSGSLDQATLERAICELVIRHESLRTTFVSVGGRPYQLIHEPGDDHYGYADLQGLPLGERQDLARQRVRDICRQTFDLARGPLFKAVLFKLDRDQHILAINMHHIISDGWSLGIMLDEMFELYDAYHQGRPSRLAPLAIQYADFSSWQRQYLTGEVLERQLRYWKQQLGGELPVLDMPVDRPRPKVRTTRGSFIRFDLGENLSRRVKSLSHAEGATAFMTLLAAFDVLLQRYCNQQDILVGTPIANRNRAEIEGLIGFFVNTLVLRADLSGNPGFRGLLGRIKETTLDAYSHQDVPFEQLVEELQPDRDVSRNPLFQVMFTLQNAPMKEMERAGIHMKPDVADIGVAHFDLIMGLEENHGHFDGVLYYNTDLFDLETVQTLVGHFTNLLTDICRHPDKRLSDLVIFSAEEFKRIVEEWNATDSPYPHDRFFQTVFERRVVERPEAVAVRLGSEELSYRELDLRANQLAHRLIHLGAGPEEIVGIALGRCTDALVAILGIFKSGAAYLPLDPEYPKDRLALMIEDAAVRLIITHHTHVEELPPHEASLICLDMDWSELAILPETAPALVLNPGQLAYVIYTSGSTGRPKGVMISQGGLSHLLHVLHHFWDVTPADRLLQSASLNFDGSVFFWAMALQAGATLCLAEKTSLLGPNLIELLRGQGITRTVLPPSLLASLDPEELPDLHTLGVAGEACSLEAARKWSQGRNFYNLYGPTEATVQVLGTRVQGNVTPPLGRPHVNTRVYLLDRFLNPVPVGVPGELHIGGGGLARGYFNRPDLAAEKFIPNPFARQGGERLYKTGDLARYLRDGDISFVGRIDHQVKIRGFRVELGEIEAILRRHPRVGDVLVLVRESSGGSRLVAYVESDPKSGASSDELRTYLKEDLPDYMVPSAIVVLAAMPLTPNGKVDRKALPEPGSVAVALKAPETEIEEAILAIWRDLLQIESIGIHQNFFDLGGHSLLVVQLHNRLKARFDANISVTDLFQYTTIAALAEFLSPNREARVLLHTNKGRRSTTREIAIIGMAGRFPGADNVAQLWQHLRDGRELIRFFSDEELLAAGVDPALLTNPNYVKASPYLEGVESFDASFFGFSPLEARLMDPQHRLFLEESWIALENAGYNPDTYPHRVGVFAGSAVSTYQTANLETNLDLVASVGWMQMGLGNLKDFVPSRVSYKLNLKGPSVNVQTACSTSLVAVHMACQSLINGDCEMALAGGVRIHIPDKAGYLYEEGGIVSPDGHCRAFDVGSQGTIVGNGLGIVVLKPLDEAIADRDNILAVIKGSAINNDGSAKIGFTAPSVEGQAKAIADAQAIAGVTPESIGYIEAHGTATELGDPIEVAALTKAFRSATDRSRFCGLGSIKSNLGHLDAAAGVAGLIKTVLALQHKIIPASLHFEAPNPKIDFDNSPFFVTAESCEWKSKGPRRAGVSSFGLGGTNAHVVLEEAPRLERAQKTRSHQLLVLSAQSETALDRISANLADYLGKQPDRNLADIAYTLQVGRRAFNHRRFLVCANHQFNEPQQALAMKDPERIFSGHIADGHRPVVFMFPGQGTQYVNMGLDLYAEEEVFKENIDYCAEFLKPLLGRDLRDLLFPKLEAADATEKQMAILQNELDQMKYAQPALFVVEYALAQLWISWGVRPSAMIGHSISEYVVACQAGVFSLEDALTVVSARGKLLGQAPAGKMMTVSLSEEELRPRLVDGLALGVINSPGYCVVSGATEAILAFEQALLADDINCRVLHISCASHSQLMEPILDRFLEVVSRAELKKPHTPYISNLTGTWIRDEEATDPKYWRAHLRNTVRFADGMATLLERADQIFLEMGPGRTLATFAKQQLNRSVDYSLLAVMRHPKDRISDVAFMQSSLGQFWLAGGLVDWNGFYAHEQRRRVPLPTYPFERKRYWVEPRKLHQQYGGGGLVKKKDLADWFYVPVWKPTMPPIEAAAAGEDAGYLIFCDPLGIGKALGAALREEGRSVFFVVAGADKPYHRVNEDTFSMDPGQPMDYRSLFSELASLGKLPGNIVHLWSVTGGESPRDRLEFSKRCQELGFYSLLFMAQTLGDMAEDVSIRLEVISDHMQEVNPGDLSHPEKATLLGPCRIIPREYPNIHCRNIDIRLQPGRGVGIPKLVRQIQSEMASVQSDPIIAWRGDRRWRWDFEPARLEASHLGKPKLREGGVYLITGGLGGIGLLLALELAKKCRARLVLVGRSKIPARSSWDQWLAEHDNDAVSKKIQQLQQVEDAGGSLLVLSADVTSIEQMQAVLEKTYKRFGAINGVIHAAGLGPSGVIQETSRLATARVLQPKVTGTLVLETLFEDGSLDFLALFSSTGSILGNMGFTDYAAANNFLDAFAEYYGYRYRTPVFSINWDAWPELRESEEALPDWLLAGKQKRAAYEMTREEGIESFLRVLNNNSFPRVVVMPADLAAMLADIREFLEKPEDSEEESMQATPHLRPNLKTQYVAARTETERAVAAVWTDMIGFDQVGMHDNFFELGGDSLSATSVAARLRKQFSVKLSPRILFDFPTPARLASHIDELLGRESVPLAAAVAALSAAPGADGESVAGASSTPEEMLAPLRSDADVAALFEIVVEQSAEAESEQGSEMAPPVDFDFTAATIAQMLDLWREATDRDDIDERAVFSDIGNLDQAARLGALLEEWFSLKVHPERILEFTVPAAIDRVLGHLLNVPAADPGNTAKEILL